MGDLFLPPTKEQIEKARRIYGDPLLCFVTNIAIKTLERLNPEDIDIQESQFNEWKFWTKRMLWRCGLCSVIEFVCNLAEQDAEEYWKNWKPPEIKDESEEVSIDPTAKALSGKIRITDLSKKYGLEVKRNKAMCPFHEGNSPSLSFSNEKGVFNCFGCEAKGDLITFVRMMEDLK